MVIYGWLAAATGGGTNSLLDMKTNLLQSSYTLQILWLFILLLIIVTSAISECPCGLCWVCFKRITPRPPSRPPPLSSFIYKTGPTNPKQYGDAPTAQ